MTYREFWPRYLRDHANPRTRLLHYIGTAAAIVCLILAVGMMRAYWIIAGIVIAYGFAWVGHFFIERNKPTAFGYPLMSLISDFRMFFLWCVGKLDAELQKSGGQP